MIGSFLLAAQKHEYIHSVSAVVMLVAVRDSDDAFNTLINAFYAHRSQRSRIHVRSSRNI